MENVDSDFFRALYSVYKKLGQFFFHTLLANLIKQRYTVLLPIFQQVNKYTNIGLTYFKNTVHMHIIPLIKL